MGIVSQNASLSKWNPQYSNLDIDGTPEKYDTNGILGNVDDPGGTRVNFSNLDIDGTPSRYDTQGQLASLGNESSDLNLDGTPDRYNTQGILSNLNDSASDLNVDGSPRTYDTQGQLSFLGPAASNLDLNETPEKYDTQGQLGSIEDSSNLNLDGTPSRYDTQGQLGSIEDSSNLNLDGTPDRYNTQGELTFLGDSSSDLNLDGTPSRYDTSGQLFALGDNSSDLNPDGTPTLYDTQGQLYGLGDNSSDLNPDGSPIPYDTQGQLFALGDNSSDLNPDGTPDRYDTQGQLFALGDNSSDLNPDGTPTFYDTQGILGSLPPNASNLDFDGPLPAGADSFLNIHANGFTIQAPIGVTQFVDPGNTSVYGFTGNLPAPSDAFPNINANGFTIQAPIGVTQFVDPGNTSIYGFAGNTAPTVDFFLSPNPSQGQEVLTSLGFPGTLPAGTDVFPNSQANGFTIQTPIGVTQFIDPGNSSIFGFTGNIPAGADSFANIHANGFTVQAPIGVTQFVDPGNTSVYGFSGPLPGPVDFITNNNAGGFTIQNPVGISQFVNNGQTSIHGWSGNRDDAPEVNFFTLPGPSGILSANGFTKFGPGYSQFLYGGQTSIYGFWSGYPDPLSFFTDTNARGFTQRNPIGISQFINNGQTSLYGLEIGNTGGGADVSATGKTTNFFTDTHAKGFTLRNPVGVTQFIDNGQTSILGLPGRSTGIDFFANTDAEGFTLGNGYLRTNFVNISGNTFNPNPASQVLTVTLGPHVPGIATLNNQLGQGSAKFRNTGFSSDNRYYEVIKNATNKSLLATWAVKENSASALETAYSYSSYYGHNLRLRDTAFNPTYMAHPLILRGLQNPDKLKPQRWGLDTSGDETGLIGALDGGFIRGGASTALVRSLIDTARIAKFLASPRGIIWTITQVGLGKSNPRLHGSLKEPEIALATKNPLPPINNTHTHLGLTSLLSVPGSAFGLHFTRHGIPFLNEAASYEYVLNSFTQAEADVPGTLFHKHLRLKDELLDMSSPNNVGVGQEISNLSYTGGPQSVYGLGRTTINRATDTLQGWKRFKPKAVPPPIEMQEVPTDTLPIEEIGSVSAQFSAKQAQDAIDANAKAAKTNAENAALADKYKKLDTEFSPKYDIKKRYAPELNQNRTGQGSVSEDKNNAQALSNKSNNPDNLEGFKAADPKFGVGKKLKDASDTNSKWSPGNGQLSSTDPRTTLNEISPVNTNSTSRNRWATMPYEELQLLARNRKTRTTTTYNDFRRSDGIRGNNDSKTYAGQADTSTGGDGYADDNIHKKYGFGEQGSYFRGGAPKDVRNPFKRSFDKSAKDTVEDTIDKLKTDPYGLAKDKDFLGDKINAIDYLSETAVKNNGAQDDPYAAAGASDFIEFYFSGIKSTGGPDGVDDFIVFRATVKNISDSFAPSWNQIQVMGRPEGPGNYSTFERSLSFDFTAYASTREELVPMWRKLNYLTTYTMPVHSGTKKPGGPLFRITIGNMFRRLPAYFTGLTLTVNEEATWDLGRTMAPNDWAKELPNIVDVNCTMRILHDWRHQLNGRSYSLYNNNYDLGNAQGSWLWDTNIPRQS